MMKLNLPLALALAGTCPAVVRASESALRSGFDGAARGVSNGVDCADPFILARRVPECAGGNPIVLVPAPESREIAAAAPAPRPAADPTVPGTGPSRVYFITGSPVPLPFAINAVEKIKRHVVGLKDGGGAGIRFFAIHNMVAGGVCAQLKALKERPRRLILMGHSMGGDAVLETARCLDPLPVDLLVMLDRQGDRYDMEESLRGVVPDNVRVSKNYYQRNDVLLILRGTSESRRADNSLRGIENTRIRVSPVPLYGHYEVLYKLVGSGALLRMIDQALEEN